MLSSLITVSFTVLTSRYVYKLVGMNHRTPGPTPAAQQARRPTAAPYHTFESSFGCHPPEKFLGSFCLT